MALADETARPYFDGSPWQSFMFTTMTEASRILRAGQRVR